MKSTRYSMQREVILKNVLLRKDHPTAEKIYEDVREAIPNISLGTVYRNLNLLAEEGKILKVDVKGKSIFDSTIKPHAHIRCEKCKNVFDIDVNLDMMNFSEKNGNLILGAEVNFFGICKNCNQKNI